MPAALRPSSARKRAAVLAAAEQVFLRDGYRAATMDEVASISGVSKQTAYAHFGSKEALFVALVTSMTEDAGERTEPEPPDAVGGVEAFLLEHARALLEAVLAPRIVRLRRLVVGEAMHFPGLGEALWTHGPAASMAWVAQHLRDFADRGWLHVPDPDRSAATWNWLVMAAPLEEAMLRGGPDEGADGLEAHCREAVRVFLAAHAA
ncbi:TetR/AcrR family transcriptional regulator [Phycicoccus avicenniae]|uniref:TetR/AcrR family transcriptional regulator n=1 Tax=Phycicoccus avicenniae TaxID=2828860 RepID=UPI002012F182|nr:TetR/AcrR family transcriptional regulator [Phycicoccus avicenniae]